MSLIASMNNSNLPVRNRFRNYISIQAVTMIFVLCARQFITNPPMVTLVSFLVMLGGATSILMLEFRKTDSRKYLTFYICLGFILCGILPVLALRIIEWNSPFDLVGMLSISGPQWEKLANVLFMATLIAHFIDSTRMRLAEQKR